MADDRVYFKYLTHRRSHLFRIARRAYLNRYRSLVIAPAVDFGCGACELLSLLGTGSLGLDVNPHCVDHGREKGLEVALYSPADDRYQLSVCQVGRFHSLVMCHVLEHIPDAQRVLGALLSSAARLGMGRVAIVVPGRMGYHSDATHTTFVTRELLRGMSDGDRHGFGEPRISYFPGNLAILGYVFRYHEMHAVFDRG